MISHPGIAARYCLHNIGQVAFENSSKEVNNLKKQENRMAPFAFTQTQVLAFSVLSGILGSFGAYSWFSNLSFSAGTSVLHSWQP
jgi:hypothetical protein